eukprot:scaffold325181_cov26-Prasinocladus_malaysianus.AAC.1
MSLVYTLPAWGIADSRRRWTGRGRLTVLAGGASWSESTIAASPPTALMADFPCGEAARLPNQTIQWQQLTTNAS